MENIFPLLWEKWQVAWSLKKFVLRANFYDGGHLNARGADEFTRNLVVELKKYTLVYIIFKDFFVHLQIEIITNYEQEDYFTCRIVCRGDDCRRTGDH